MKKPPLTPGTRIKFEGPMFLNGHIQRFFAEPMKATVAESMRCHRDEQPGQLLTVTINKGEIYEFTAHICRRQVVSVLRPKAAKPKEERVERWITIHRFPDTGRPDGRETLHSFAHAGSVRLVELRDSERIVSREDLARAFGLAYAQANPSLVLDTRLFDKLVTALGFGGDV